MAYFTARLPQEGQIIVIHFGAVAGNGQQILSNILHFRAGFQQLVPGGGKLFNAGLLEQVRAIDHAPCAAVPGKAVNGAVAAGHDVKTGGNKGVDQFLRNIVRDGGQFAHFHKLYAPGSAQHGDIRRGFGHDRIVVLRMAVAPVDVNRLYFNVRIGFVEGPDRVVDDAILRGHGAADILELQRDLVFS